MERLVEAQGGDPRVVAEPRRLDTAPVVREVRAETRGCVLAIEPRALGHAVVAMGGGRTHLGQSIDASVGFLLRVAPGDRVGRGDVVAEIHAADTAGLECGEQALKEALRVGEGEARLRPLVSHRVTGSGTERLPGADSGAKGDAET